MAIPLTRSKTNPGDEADAALSTQIDTLQQIAKTERDDILGPDFFSQIRALYNLGPQQTTQAPSFRPRVSIPELQTLALLEANDLSDISPRAYLIKNRDTLEQDTRNQDALQAQCRESEVNMHILLADLWSYFGGNGFLQVGWDPNAFHGRGTIDVRDRDPETVYPDPYARDDEHLKFLIFEDYMWIDEVRSLWPERAHLVKAPVQVAKTAFGPGTTGSGGLAGNLQFPAGPMRNLGNLPGTPRPGDSRIRIRTLFVFDPAVSKARNSELDDRLKTEDLPKPKFTALYPYGRMIIEAERIRLFDGHNPFKHGQFPLVRFIGFPALHSFWAPPPARYTKLLQELGERFYTQLYENVVRTNNGIYFIDESSGVDPNRFGGVPGELQMLAMGSKVPEVKWPPPIPPHMSQIPEQLFAIQRRLAGFTDTRIGQTPPGNVSPGFLEGAVQQAHGLTKLRAKLQYRPLRRLYYLIFATMAQYYTSPRRFFKDDPSDKGYVEWTPIDNFKDYDLYIDPDSVFPFSATLLANRVPLLRNMGLLSVKSASRLIKLPDAERNWQELQEEAQMAAIAQLQKQTSKKPRK